MTEHEKRVSEMRNIFLGAPKGATIWEIMLLAHTAGFEAGLRARLPSREEFFEVVNNGVVFLSADEIYDWLAANMRKGDV